MLEKSNLREILEKMTTFWVCENTIFRIHKCPRK
nr:MAG TPA: hypothetical protein [Caudoviricetes sp.]